MCYITKFIIYKTPRTWTPLTNVEVSMCFDRGYAEYSEFLTLYIHFFFFLIEAKS